VAKGWLCHVVAGLSLVWGGLSDLFSIRLGAQSIRPPYTDSRSAAMVEEDEAEGSSRGGRKVGRDSPSFFMRLRSVLGLIPNRLAAPSGP
jgi:hypothetical protein